MSAYSQKIESLKADGFEPIGVILIDPKTGKRVTVDHFGRVQWWTVRGDGLMVADVAVLLQSVVPE